MGDGLGLKGVFAGLSRHFRPSILLLLYASTLFSGYLLFTAGYLSRVPSELWSVLGFGSTKWLFAKLAVAFAASLVFSRVTWVFVLWFLSLGAGVLREMRLQPNVRYWLLRIRKMLRGNGLIAVFFLALIITTKEFENGWGFQVLSSSIVTLGFFLTAFPAFFRVNRNTGESEKMWLPLFESYQKPKGVDDVRWYSYLAFCAALYFSLVCYQLGRASYETQIIRSMTLQVDDQIVEVGVIASNSKGILVRSIVSDTEEVVFKFWPYSSIENLKAIN